MTAASPSSATTPTASTTAPAHPRGEQFRHGIAELRIREPQAARGLLLARLGGVGMAAGLVLGVVAYLKSHGSTNPLDQRDAIVLGLLAVGLCVVGAAVFLRYSFAGFLRLWLARLVLHQEAGEPDRQP